MCTNLPVLHGLEANASTIRATALVPAAEGTGASKGHLDEFSAIDTETEDGFLELSDVAIVNDRALLLGNRVLPEEHLRRNLRTQPAATRAHVTVEQLEPSARESIVELVRVLEEASRDLVVCGIEAQGQIGRQHSRHVLLVRVVGVGNDLVVGLCLPLTSTTGRLDLLPLVLVHVFEIVVACKSVSTE